MALGDGTTWDETLPTDAVFAIQIDDYNRDLRVGVRARMAREHEWPSSQAATSEAGAHKFMTLQEQATKPTLSGTQKAAVYANTANNLSFEKSNGTVVPIIVGTELSGSGRVLVDSTATAAGYLVAQVAGIESSGTDSARVTMLNAWTTGTYDTVVAVTQDCIIMAIGTATGNDTGTSLTIKVDAAATPTTVRAAFSLGGGAAIDVGNYFSAQSPARSGDNYLVESVNLGTSQIVYVMNLGAA